MQENRTLTRFEDQIYENICCVYPETSVRSFSEMLGKSSGYWSSISAQQLPVSVSALVNLIDAIEARKILLDSTSSRHSSLTKLQEQIKSELIARFQLKTGIGILINRAMNSDFSPLPFIVNSY
jgi:ubiquinone biosynthesis protein COQ9